MEDIDLFNFWIGIICLFVWMIKYLPKLRNNKDTWDSLDIVLLFFMPVVGILNLLLAFL